MSDDKLQYILRKALEMEEKGYAFYKDIVKKVQNDITKKTFQFLADNELLHIESIKKFYDTLKRKGELPELGLDKVDSKRAEELGIFSKNISGLKDKIKPSDSDKEACEFAMEFENSGYKYYEDMLKDAKDEKLIKLLKFLLSEEKVHYETIMNLHSYVSDSANWYMYEEESFPQGG
jgi:rubrerythrin